MTRTLILGVFLIFSFFEINAQEIRLTNIDSLRAAHDAKNQLSEISEAKTKKFFADVRKMNMSEAEMNYYFRESFECYGVSTLEGLEKIYYELITRDKLKSIEIDLQIDKIDSLQIEMEENRTISKRKLDSIREENVRLKLIMKHYVLEIESAKDNKLASIENADEYYYKLEDVKKTLVYHYVCHADSTNSQYWIVSSKPRKRIMTTNAYNYQYDHFEFFEERFDSIGSKLKSYKMIDGDNVIECIPKQLDVYKWKSDAPYTYSVDYSNEYGDFNFSKTREYIRLDTLDVMGESREVLIFKSTYHIVNSESKDEFHYEQFSYYAKELGFVRYERIYPEHRFVVLELEGVHTKKEWKKLIK